jgi:hypothetical protein
MGQYHNPKIATDGLICHLDPTNGGKGASKIIAKPTQISDCILWLDADDAETVVTSGANITNWLDKSGKGNHARDHGATEYPQYDSSRINGRKVVNFVNPDVLKGAFASGSQPFSGSGTTIISVIKQNTFVGDEFMAWFEAAQGAFASGSYGNRIVFSIYGAAFGAGGSADKVRMASDVGTTSWGKRIENNAAVMGVYTNDSSTTKTYFNGEFIGKHGEDKGDDARTYYCLGDDMTSGDHFNGYICEIIIYNKVLSDAERQSIEYYLSRKWAIPLKNRAMTNLANGDRVGELFPNGDFPSGLSDGETGYDNGDGTVDGWSLSAGGSPTSALSVASDTPWGRGLRVNKNSSGYSYANAYLNVSNLKTGSIYKASVTYDLKTAASIAFGISGATVSVHPSTSGTYVTTWVETGTSQLFYCYVYGTDAVYADFSNFSVVEVGGSPVETTNKNTFYFPNPDVDNCNLALEANEIAVADNLPWTVEFWIKRHTRGNMGSGNTYDGVWGNSYTSSAYERMQFGIGDEDKLWFGDNAGNGGEITNIADIDCLHKWRHVVLAFDGTTDPTTAGSLRQYVDGSDKGPAIALTTAPSGITVQRIGSRGHLTDANRLEGELGNFRVYDKQLSHAEVLQNYNAQRAKYQNKKMSFVMLDENTLTSDFSAGTDSWGAGGGGIVGNIDSIGPSGGGDNRNDCLRFTCNSAASTHYMHLPSAVHGASVGDSIRITFDYFIPAGQSHVDGIGMYMYGPHYPQPYYSTMNTTNAWTSVDVTFEVTQAYGFIINGADGGVNSFTDTGNDVFYIRNFKYHRPPGGLRLYLDAQSGTSSNYYANGTWYDISGGTVYNATRSNATFTDEGVKYYAFDGTGDKFDANEIEGVFAEVTFSFWMFKSSQTVTYGNIFDCSHLFGGGGYSNRGPRLEVVAAGNIITLVMGSDAGAYVATATNPISNDEWVQVTYTIKTETNIAGSATSQTTKAYVDGVLHIDTTRTDHTYFWGWDGTVVNPTIPNLNIGLGFNSGRYFTGGIANFMIYDTVLSADQIVQNYNYFKHRFGK